MKRLLLGLLAAAACVRAAETDEVRRGAFASFLQGRLEDAASSYRYLAALGGEELGSSVNLALVAREKGLPEEALPLWVKATLLAPTDSFLWSQRGWCYLSMGRGREARDAFLKAVDVSSGSARSAEANFGLGLTLEQDGRRQPALDALILAGVQSPYLFPAASAGLGRVAGAMRRLETAELYQKQSLNQDPAQPGLARELAATYERMNFPRAAWLAYKLLLDMDPSDEQAVRGFEKHLAYLQEAPERLLPVRRAAGPLLRRFTPPPSSAPVRVRLFANAAGEPAQLRRVFFMSGADFKLVDLKLGEVNRGKAGEQWEVLLRPESGVVEVRDKHRQLQYATKQPFRVEPAEPGASVLLKSAEIADLKGVDIGDRELRGATEVQPTPFGFQLVNQLGLEEYLYSQVAAAMPAYSPPEALKAEAVLARTRLEALREKAGAEGFHLCDSAHCHVYSGLAQERLEATQAVLATLGGKLYKEGALAEARQHPYCGGRTEDGIEDAPQPQAPPGSPWELERLSHDPPPRGSYCEASALVPPSWARWTRLIDAQDIQARAEKQKYIGRLLSVLVLRRSAAGRVQAVDLVGARERLTLEGEEAIARVLYPGGLRSMLFTLQPLYKGKALQQLLVWGIGTGDGRGLCVAGALGQAHLGGGFREILARYFPGTEIRGLNPAPLPLPVEPIPPVQEAGLAPTPAARPQGKSALEPARKPALDPEKARRRRALREQLKRKARETLPSVSTQAPAAASSGDKP